MDSAAVDAHTTAPFAMKQSFAPPSTYSTRFLMWKQCATCDIPFTQLEERTRHAMKYIFSVDKLRLLQPKAVKCALKRKSQIVVMATGGGTSPYIFTPLFVLYL
jgi:superfamily II DNA helicase RecQ